MTSLRNTGKFRWDKKNIKTDQKDINPESGTASELVFSFICIICYTF